jgi:hypothetical protein
MEMFCGTDLNNRNLHTMNGERYEINRKNFESRWFGYLNKLFSSTTEIPIVTIPVVVHVVYKKEIENISDSQIHSQIDVLNREYRNRNNDLGKVPDVWKLVIGDARIEFKLAVRDSEGNPTSGITRTKTDNDEFLHGRENDKPLPEMIKFSSQGGIDAWDTSRYLNLWVCNLFGSDNGTRSGTIGYSQFPDEPPRTDGVVMRYDAFGNDGTVRPPLHLGRVTVHECGHYFGLYHIWGDNSDFEEGNKCSTGGDNIDDTPNQADNNRGVPTFPSVEQSCPDTGNNGTMFMNHMDYTDDEIRCMFTLGQVARMRYTLETSRRSLIQNDALISHSEQSRLSALRNLPPVVYDGLGAAVKIEKLL